MRSEALTFETSLAKEDIFKGLKSLEESKYAARSKESISLFSSME
mgnify:CR=1 FL=1